MATRSSLPPQPLDRRGFHIALICAKQIESEALQALFDHFWEEDGTQYTKAVKDPNFYILGVMGQLNVVLVHLPGMNNTNSASAIASLNGSFPNIKLGLVVGICGGVPQSEIYGKDIFLGDIIISTQVIQYDFGWQYPDKFTRKNTLDESLGPPPKEIRGFLQHLCGILWRRKVKERIQVFVENVTAQAEFKQATRPKPEADRLFEASYRHKHHSTDECQDCAKCNQPQDPVCQTAGKASCDTLKCDKLVPRTPPQNPELHFGQIASGNTVLKSAQDRDGIAGKESIIGFEMEGAGAWDNTPTVVIKAVCDYADSHKNDNYHHYASVVAAACTKAVLEYWREED